MGLHFGIFWFYPGAFVIDCFLVSAFSAERNQNFWSLRTRKRLEKRNFGNSVAVLTTQRMLVDYLQISKKKNETIVGFFLPTFYGDQL